MRLVGTLLVWIAGAMLVSHAPEAQAQGQCTLHGGASGTVPACGTAPGYFRPQTWTMSPNFVPQRPPSGSYYAPIGPNGRSWKQYDAGSGKYGPVEPNPYGTNGRLSPSRTLRHVYETRVKPRIQRRYNSYRNQERSSRRRSSRRYRRW